MPAGYVYILANRPHGTLYIGITSDLQRRIYEHKQRLYEGFTKKYNIDKLVYFEAFDGIETAIIHEKRLKKHFRYQKIALIESMNPEWHDLTQAL